MAKVIVQAMGIDSNHDPGVYIDRPFGLPLYLVMCFRTPFLCRTTTGIVEGKPGNCVVHSPSFPHWMGPRQQHSEGFRNDWVHLTGPGVSEMVMDMNIPTDQIIPGDNPGLLMHVLEDMERERQTQEPHWERALELRAGELFLLLGRLASDWAVPLVHSGAHKYLPALSRARSEMRRRFAESWTVDTLASMAGIGPNQFAVLYKQFFGVSPVEDLINRRIDHATYLLSGSSAPVSQVALACGYDNPYYFSRLFRKRIGNTPTGYRRSYSQ